VSAAETRAVADAAVDAFLAAYGADGPEGAAGNVNER
jgi:hypothetical protein